MFLRLVFFSALIMCFFNTKAQKAFHFGGMANFSNSWILNQNNFGTLDGFNNTFARRSELDYSITIGGPYVN